LILFFQDMNNPVALRSEMPIWRQMDLISRLYQNALSQQLRHLGIERHFYMMLVIDEGNGHFTQQDMADVLEIDKVIMVGIIDYLSDNGFVARKENKEDGRKHRIVLTAKARAALPEIRKRILSLNKMALSELPANLSENFMEILGLIRGTLENIPVNGDTGKKRRKTARRFPAPPPSK
jgi:MarR family transcriptional regulator, transcriptional regulator for hemolysin